MSLNTINQKLAWKSILLVATSLILIGGCNQKAGNGEQGTIISGNIQFPETNKLYFYSFADSVDFFLARQTPIDSALIQANGDFSFHLTNGAQYVFKLQLNGKELLSNLLILPGDKLEINFYGKQHTPKIVPYGNAAKFNSFLLKFVDKFYKEKEVKNEYYIASNYMDPNHYEIYTNKRKKDMLNFFNSYFENDSILPVYSSFVVNSIYYELASDRLMYLWKKRMKGEPIAPDSSFFYFTEPSFVQNSSAFVTPSYIRFLNLYIKDTYERMVERGELPLNKKDKLIPSVEKYRIASELLDGTFEDAALYSIIVNDGNDVSDSTINVYKTRTSLDALKASFKSKYGFN